MKTSLKKNYFHFIDEQFDSQSFNYITVQIKGKQMVTGFNPPQSCAAVLYFLLAQIGAICFLPFDGTLGVLAGPVAEWLGGASSLGKGLADSLTSCP